MKNIYTALLLFAAAGMSLSAEKPVHSSGTHSEKPLFEEITGIKKKTDKFNLFLNMHTDYRADFTGSSFDEGKFEMKQLRIEAKGNINKWIFYRYRQRLNKGEGPDGNFDNVLQSIDIAEVGFRFGKFDVVAGRQCAAYGGIEFDINPIDIYEYSDMIGYIHNFTTGVRVAYNMNPEQQFQFQVMNSIKTSVKSLYGDLPKSKLPLLFVLNWNGKVTDFYNTRWSVSYANQTKGNHNLYFALGNEFTISDRASAYVDWMYSREGADIRGIVTDIVGMQDGHKALNAEYMSTVVHFNWFVAPKWNLFVKGMYETAGIYKSTGAVPKGRLRTSWGYMGGVEFYPLKERTLHFFLVYVGRSYKYAPNSWSYGVENYSTSRISAGLIWQIPVF